MPFVKFTESGKSFVPRASISDRGIINLTDGAVRKFNMKDYSHAAMYYDKETQRIGIELQDAVQQDGIKIRFRDTGGAGLGSKSFLDFFNIMVKQTTLYNVLKGDLPNWLIIDLKSLRVRNKPTKAE